MKVTKTYSIEETVFNAFDYVTTERNINKSSFIEESIRKYLKDNDIDFVDKYYYLKSDPNHVVSVVSQDASYYLLNDGSKMNKILFMQIFDVVTPVIPEEFLKPNEKLYHDIIDKIKNSEIDYESEIKKLLKEKDIDFEELHRLIDEKLVNSK